MIATLLVYQSFMLIRIGLPVSLGLWYRVS